MEGRNSWVGQYAISASTDNYDLALEFLDGERVRSSEAAWKHDVLSGMPDDALVAKHHPGTGADVITAVGIMRRHGYAYYGNAP